MDPIFDTQIPDGFHNVNLYLFADNPAKLIDFLCTGLFAEEIDRTVDETNGKIRNCILRMGNSCFMIGQARGKYKSTNTSLYLYVSDTDKVYTHALQHGAISEMEPGDMSYGERQAGIIDPVGNIWWISTRLASD